MNRVELETKKERLEYERRKIDNELAPVLDGLRKLKLLEFVIDECDNGSGHYYKELWTEHCPSGDNDARLLCAMANDGLLRVKGYNGEIMEINSHVESTARFIITPKGRAVMEESEKELVLEVGN